MKTSGEVVEEVEPLMKTSVAEETPRPLDLRAEEEKAAGGSPRLRSWWAAVGEVEVAKNTPENRPERGPEEVEVSP
ncbi:hypothetical protein NHX12_025540 [Muraenolepis orangiensis]|uniref:Uncharacterized protein n=1 Tax=Muraenolepis orangiensis TaxID=630683 RepID=A0A9Q0EMX5_9TELE|nr:hypothetical protein NHX12_025540 [Muraenolepis orangiensis]